MFENESRVLLILQQDLLDRARALAGRATASLTLPVSLQIVLRALIEEGLKGGGDRPLLANIEAQARAVRRIRSLARRREPVAVPRGAFPPGRRRTLSRSGPDRRSK